jgi:hypothetical protein
MAYLFTAASSQYFIGNSAPVTAEPMSIVGWFRPRVAVASNQFIACIGSSANPSHLRIGVDTAGTRAQKFDTVGGNWTAQSSGSVAAGTWVHIAGTIDASGNLIAYRNGAAGASVAATGAISYNRMVVGARIATGSLSFFADGEIAEVGVYNAVLTPDEIAGLAKGFACRFARPSALAWYSRLIRNAMDIRGGLALTNTNGATVSTHPRIIYP